MIVKIIQSILAIAGLLVLVIASYYVNNLIDLRTLASYLKNQLLPSEAINTRNHINQRG